MPAEYNPRKITDESYKKLKESLKKFGICKPVIANKNGVIIAGHQRTRAMKEVGIKTCPIFMLDRKVAIHDEIRFNLMHNRIESETSKCMIVGAENLEGGFSEINCDKIKIIRKGKGPFIKEICSLLVKYGDFGAVIIKESGEILHNNDYAF